MAAVSPAIYEGKRITPGATWNLVNRPYGADYVIIRPIAVSCKLLLRQVADGTAVGAEYLTLSADSTVSFSVAALDGINLSSAGDVEVCFVPKGA